MILKFVFTFLNIHFISILKDEGVRTRNQFGIGEGKIVKKEKLPQFECTLNVVEEGGHTGDSFWSSLDANDKEETSAAVEPTKEEASDHSVSY